MRWLLPLLITPLAACGAALPAVPGKGGPAWLELTSVHFVVWTDTDEQRGRELVREMEHFRQVVMGTGFASAQANAQVFVFALRNDAELHAFVPEQFAAEASPADGNVLRQAMVVLSADSNFNDTDLVEAHELTHVISYGVIQRQPRWFAEGLAKYYETIEIDARHGTVDVGREPMHRGQRLVMHHMIPFAQLRACVSLDCADAGFYATAWAFYTFLVNVHPKELALYEQELVEDADHAWDLAFGALPELEIEMRNWLVSGSHTILHFNVKLAESPVSMRRLDDADVYATRALLRFELADEHSPQVGRDVDAALAVDPTNVIAHLVALTMHRPVSIDAAQATVKAHPNDWRAWFLLAVVAHDEGAHQRVCEAAAANRAIASALCSSG